MTVVTGHFDPLLASHVRRLAEIAADAGRLVVVIADGGNPILPARARAELVAGLGVVAFVVLPGEESVESVLERLRPDNIIREERGDEERTRELIRHVHSRQHAL